MGRPITKTTQDEIYDYLMDYKQLMLDTMKKTKEIKEVKRISKKIDELDKFMEKL